VPGQGVLKRPMAAPCSWDELGNLSGSGQAKLLRVLQTGEFERLGSNATHRTRVRVIAATNSKPAARHSRGRFREDLFYRLNVIELEIPALMDRRETSERWPVTFSSPGSRSRRMHWTLSHATRGRVMSGNCRTRFAARACCHPTKRSRHPLSFSRSSQCSRRPMRRHWTAAPSNSAGARPGCRSPGGARAGPVPAGAVSPYGETGTEGMMRTSLTGRTAGGLGLAVLLAAAVTAVAGQFFRSPLIAALVGILASVPLVLWLAALVRDPGRAYYVRLVMASSACAITISA